MRRAALAALAAVSLALAAPAVARAEVARTDSAAVGRVFGQGAWGPLDVSPLRARARASLRGRTGAWSRAAALRNLVRASYPHGVTCDLLATAMWLLARESGLPVRIAVGSSNLRTWAYDSHTTVEVRVGGRWIISDPTFGGYFTEGRRGRKLGAADLSALVNGGRNGRVFWHRVPVTNGLPMTGSSPDVRDVFANFAVVAATPDGEWGFVTTDARRALLADRVLVSRAGLARASAAIPVVRATRPPLPPFTPPSGRLVWRGELSGPGTLPGPRGGVVLVVASAPVAVGGFPTHATGDGRFVSPAAVPAGSAWLPLLPGAVTVELYSVPGFPRTHEVR